MTEPLDCGSLEGAETTVCHEPWDCIKPIQHFLNEFVIDPSCNLLSASRLMFILINVFGGAAAMGLVVCGFWLNVHQAFTPASVIFTGLAASDAGVYYASTKKQYRCNGE